MITVFIKLDKSGEGYFFNLSNGWTRKVVGDEVYKMLIFYMTSNEYRVFIDDQVDMLLSQAVKFVECDGFTQDQIKSNLRQLQFNKYMCSSLKFIEK